MNQPPDSPRERGFLGRLAVIALLAGTAGSLGLFLRAGQRTPRPLLVVFVIWVLSPFMALAVADAVSKGWSTRTRATLHGVMLVVALGALAVYGRDALRPRKAQPAFVYVIVPPVSWLLMAAVIPIAAFASGRRSRPRDRAREGPWTST